MKLDWYCVKDADFSNVPEEEGVYIISTLQNLDHEFEVKYVGQASDLRSRANEHWSKNETNKELKNHIAKGYTMKYSYALVSGQNDRDQIERYLYDYFEPKYNKILPPGNKGGNCNLPNVRKKL